MTVGFLLTTLTARRPSLYDSLSKTVTQATQASSVQSQAGLPTKKILALSPCHYFTIYYYYYYYNYYNVSNRLVDY